MAFIFADDLVRDLGPDQFHKHPLNLDSKMTLNSN